MPSWLSKSSTKKKAVIDKDGDLFDEEFQRRLEYLAIVSKRVVSGRMRAERRSKKTGAGIEFADYREYAPGDDFRYIDWNVYQRSGRLLLRLFEEEEDLSVYIIVDASRSMGMGEPAKLRYAKQVAAALSYVALANLDRVSVLSFGEKMEGRLAPTRGKNRVFKVFEFLRGVEATGTTDLQTSLKTFAAQNKRKGVAILISDLYDPKGFEDGINQLRYARFETTVLHISDPRDLEPELNGDVRLVDRETGAHRDVTITPRLLAKYKRAHEEYQARIQGFCRDKQVGYFPMRTDIAFDDAILNVLRKGGVVR